MVIGIMIASYVSMKKLFPFYRESKSVNESSITQIMV